MSSRALRKLQREQEEKKKQKQLGNSQEEAQSDESEVERTPAPKAFNAFDMLSGDDENDGGVESQEDIGDGDSLLANTDRVTAQTPIATKPKPKKSKKKKNKKKGHEQNASEAEATKASEKDPQLDEIDLALNSLSTRSNAGPGTIPAVVPLIDPAHDQLNRLLAVESKHLNALNEMKRLFGNVVLENDDEGPGTPRRRGRGPQQLDLGGALAARNSPIARGQGLAGIALRRNFLIQGKEEWPKAAGGGLGMELVERLDDGTIEYRFVHNTIYQDVQRQFMSCVESMDPQRMISMLVYNPYHVSTLLQVSEIAKQQGDHSVSGDLLERALFTYGRSVHSSFTNALSGGKARLNFERPENREFWLAAWRYMNNLGQRGTWRTAYEWAKLILSLDPELDPYCIHKVMDQLALRGGQAEHFLELSKCSSLWHNEDVWQRSPNVAISSALVESHLKNPQQCRATLKESIESYPWIFTRLFQELNLQHIPKSIWGKTPRTPREKLDCETYVSVAKDLWNTPEATSLLVEVASYAVPPQSPTLDSRPITLDEARHAVLSGIPAIIDCIPRAFTTQSTSSFDPFPPIENLPSYDPSSGAGAGQYRTEDGGLELDDEDDVDSPPVPPNLDHLEVDPETAQRTDVRGLQSFFTRFIPWLGRSEATTGENHDSAAPGPNNEIEAAIAASAREAHEAGLPAAEIQQRGTRLLEQANPAVGVVGHGPNGEEHRMDPSEGLALLVARARELGSAVNEGNVGGTVRAGEPRSQQAEDALDGDDNDNEATVTESNRALQEDATATRDITHQAALATEATAEPATENARAPPTNQQPFQPSVSDALYETDDDDDNNDNNNDSYAATTHPSASTPSAQTQTQTQSPHYDDDRNQRWLAGQGMLALKAHFTAHPSHNNDDNNDEVASKGHALLTEYAARVLLLKRERSRRFILDYALRQGAGMDVGDAVEREVARLRKERETGG